MRDWSIIILCGMGAALGAVVLFHPHSDVATNAQVINLATGLISGAFGAAAGHAVGRSTSVSTAAPVTVNQGDPKGPVTAAPAAEETSA